LMAIVTAGPTVVSTLTAMAVAAGRLAVSINLALGPAGWIALAVAGIYGLGKAYNDGSASADVLRDAIRNLNIAQGQGIEFSVMAARQARDEAKARLEAARASLIEAEAMAQRLNTMRAAGGVREGGQDIRAYTEALSGAASIGKLRNEIESLESAIGDANESITEGEKRLEAYRIQTEQTGGDGGGIDAINNKTQQFIDKLKEQLETMGMNQDQLLEYAAAQAIAADETGKYAGEIKRLVAAIIERRGYQEAVKATEAFRAKIAQIRVEMGGPSAQAAKQYADAIKELAEQYGSIPDAEFAEALALINKRFEEQRQAIEDNTEEALWLKSILEDFDNIGMRGLIREINRVEEALLAATDPKMVEALKAELVRLQGIMVGVRQQGLETMIGASQQVLSSIQGMTKEGSKAYKAMEVASQALNVVLAIGAILNQGKGDPYTAFARMAAMAAAVASLVGSIGANFSGGFSDTAGERQSTQGRGTVLGDAEAQSESIANATQITADATSQLVGINRGMLRALIHLQNAIGAATGMLARGGRTADFSDLPAAGRFGDMFSNFGSQFLDPLNLLGGSSRITDQGIVIMGGALTEMVENIAIGAYQEVQTRRWRFGRRRTNEEIVDVSDELGTQFQLIISSIVDTVREGALALGLLPAEVEEALASFRLAEIRISTMDLSAEEQQAELAAVFSSIFDNLAGHVVPFIDQFQRVGEGLGETLVRVATSVQVMQEAIKRLGLSVDETDPERFAQISVALIDMVGGLDEFISQMLSFVDKFAPEAHKFAVAQQALTDAFSQFGIAIPETRDGMWEFMQSLDATTEAGREQIAILLQLVDVSDAYYTALERQAEALQRATEEYAAFVADIESELAMMDLTQFQRSMVDARMQYRSHVQALEDAARAAGLTEARTGDLTRAQELYARRVAQLVAQLIQSGQQLAAQLGLTPLSAIEAEIARIQSETTSSMSSIGQAFRDATDSAQSFADALLIGDMSPLGSAEKLSEAIRQFNEAQTLAQRQQIGQTILGIGRDRFASGAEYARLFEMVQQGLRGFSDPEQNMPQEIGFEVSSALSALFKERDQLMAEEAERQRILQARDLAQIIADLMQKQGVSLEEAFAQIGVLPEQLMDILGMDAEAFAAFIDSLTVDAISTADAIFDSTDRIVDELVLIRELMADSVERDSEDPLTGGRGSRPDMEPEPERPVDREIADRTGEVGDTLRRIETEIAELFVRIKDGMAKSEDAQDRTARATETLAFSGGLNSDRTSGR
jgi:hypothetical protein